MTTLAAINQLPAGRYVCGTGEPPEDADYCYRGTLSPKGWVLWWRIITDDN